MSNPTKKLPAHVIPMFKMPKNLLQKIRAIERKQSGIERKWKRELSKKLLPLQHELEDIIDDVRDKYGLSPQHIFETSTGTIVLVHNEQQQLIDIPDLPELIMQDDNIETDESS